MNRIEYYRPVLLVVVAALLVYLPSSGCATVQQTGHVERISPINNPDNVQISPHYYQHRPARVAIVIPQNRMSDYREQEVFAEFLATELRNAGIADTVVAEIPSACANVVATGRIDAHQLVDISRRYTADAVLYVDVTSISTYSPLSASVSFVLIDAREAIPLLVIDKTWDVRDRQIAASFQIYNCRSTRQDSFASSIYTHSPTEFLNFAAYDLARYLSTVR